MYVWLNVGSLLLGLIAWILPLINLANGKKSGYSVKLSLFSISACATALFFQIYYQYHLVEIEDWAAIMDTTGGVLFVSAILLIGTLLLNTISYIRYHSK